MSNSTKSAKPRKPHKDFPLFPHATRRWAKKIRGKLRYFGPWGAPEAALEKWLAEKDDLLAGRVPRTRREAEQHDLRELCNRFLTTKKNIMDAKDLCIRSFQDYHLVCEYLIKHFGPDRLLTDMLPEDFEALRMKWAKSWGPVRLGNVMNVTRVIFNYAYKSGLIASPIRYGEGFRRPSKKTLRLARAAKGIQMFEADEVKRMLEKAKQPLRTMVLLAVNCGLGNADCGGLQFQYFDLDGGWLNYARPKTGVNRRCKLWPKTVAAFREWIPRRPTAKDDLHSDLVFITAKGDSWNKNTSDNPISKEMKKLLNKLGIGGSRNFYALRHTFETIGGETGDQVAVDYIMGHARDDMASIYRERISDDRLVAVTDYVHDWLFGRRKKNKTAAVSRIRKMELSPALSDADGDS